MGPQSGRPTWWRELLYVAAFYTFYSFIRNWGVATDSARQAFANARAVIRVERLFGLYHEETVQDVFVDHDWFIRLWNVFYGSAHFLVTAAVLVWLFRKSPPRYRKWRNILAVTTALALAGFALFPLMPPRLLPGEYGFTDTLAEVGGLWSFDSDAVAKVSNQYAAMPSLHFAWALWSSLAVLAAARRRLAKVLALAYPALTLFAVVVTANHFWLDAVGGAAVLGAGALLAGSLARRRPGLVSRRSAPAEAAVVFARPAPVAAPKR